MKEELKFTVEGKEWEELQDAAFVTVNKKAKIAGFRHSSAWQGGLSRRYWIGHQKRWIGGNKLMTWVLRQYLRQVRLFVKARVPIPREQNIRSATVQLFMYIRTSL